jgi:hypothetical protein
MVLPDYWLPRPAMDLDDQVRSAFDQLLTQIKSAGTNTLITYTLTPPKWQFLCYLAEQHAIAMHGTGEPDICVFEPRQSNDLNAFGNQTAVYAAGDGLWAMFFAIVDREAYSMSLNNACIRLSDATGQVGEPRYLFSISETALRQQPWRIGFVYLLPPDTFVAQPPLPFGPYEVHIPQLASPAPVTPLARLEIEPGDFPFLAQIRGHEDARLHEYAQALQTGGPWPDSPGTDT